MPTQQTRLQDLATSIATQIKTIKTQINGNLADLSGLTTAAKNSLVAAINELRSELTVVQGGAGASINDASNSSTTQTYSIDKIKLVAAAAVDAIVAGAPAAINTLDELAASIGDDANFAATVTTALGNRVRHDIANQGLTALQQSNARTNINAYGPVELGNPDTDLVAVFVAGLA